MSTGDKKEKKVKKENKKKQTGSGNISRKKSKSKKRRIALFIVIVILAALGTIAFFYYKNANYYKDHFYRNTSINGVDCSDLSVDEAKEAIQKSIDKYVLNFTDHEGRESSIDALSLGITYTDDGEINKLLSQQNFWMWVIAQAKQNDYQISISYTYDENALDTWISELPCVVDGVAPEDAHEMELADGYYRIVEESYGDEIDVDNLKEYIKEAINSGTTSVAITEGQEGIFKKPSVYSDDEELKSQIEDQNKEVERQKKIDSVTDASVTLNSYIDGAYLNSNYLKDMIVDDENGDPIIDKDKIFAWVRQWAEKRGFTTNSNLFVTHDGKLVEVPNGNLPGWSLDTEATAQKVYDAILSNEHSKIFPVLYDENGKKLTETSYIEICIEHQNLRYYVNGNVVVDTPVVTGDTTKGYDTPSDGVWYIYGKYTNYTMRGDDYVTFVEYAMPFNDQIFIHDLSTRIEYGGTIYQGSGSHGCINTPYDAVVTIFNSADIGTPVIVHTY